MYTIEKRKAHVDLDILSKHFQDQCFDRMKAGMTVEMLIINTSVNGSSIQYQKPSTQPAEARSQDSSILETQTSIVSQHRKITRKLRARHA